MRLSLFKCPIVGSTAARRFNIRRTARDPFKGRRGNEFVSPVTFAAKQRCDYCVVHYAAGQQFEQQCAAGAVKRAPALKGLP